MAEHRPPRPRRPPVLAKVVAGAPPRYAAPGGIPRHPVPEEQPLPQHRSAAVLTSVVERLSESLPYLVGAMLAAAEERWPAYRPPNADPADARTDFRRVAGLLVRALEERRDLRPDELVTVHVIGAQRARQGMPVDHMIDRMRAALRVGWEHVFDLAGEDGSLVLVRDLSLRHMQFMHDVLDALETGYATEREQRLSGQVRAQAAFVDRLLEGNWDTDAEIGTEAGALGHDLSRLCGLLMLLPGATHDTEGLRTAASDLAAKVAGAVEGPMRTLPVLHVVVLLPVASTSAWAHAMATVAAVADHHRLVIVPVEPTAHATALSHLYRRAQRYLTLAHSAGADSGVVTVKDLRLYAVLAGIPLADRLDFVRDMLGPIVDLPAHKTDELLETLEVVYRRRGRIAEAAADLHLHQNSIRYRLNRIEQLTGLRLDVPAERMHLELAMRLRWVAKAELATLDDPTPPRVRARSA